MLMIVDFTVNFEKNSPINKDSILYFFVADHTPPVNCILYPWKLALPTNNNILKFP